MSGALGRILFVKGAIQVLWHCIPGMWCACVPLLSVDFRGNSRVDVEIKKRVGRDASVADNPWYYVVHTIAG